MAATHEVFNQSVPLEGHDVAGLDVALREGVQREGGEAHLADLRRIGILAGDPVRIREGELANRNPPELHQYDRFGHRIDEVEYHPAYHSLMTVAVAEGLAGAPWADDRPGAHVGRAAKFAVWTQVEAGHGCPISMTYSVVPALRAEPSLAGAWEPLLTSTTYDPTPGHAPEPGKKVGAIAGMAMTEKQGGSDVRANTTKAAPTSNASGPGEEYALTGHKWFCSAPMSDLFLMLAYTDAGLSCFAVPRWLPDGTRNAIGVQRLKDKLGNKSNASSEIELDGALGRLVGDEGRGIPTILAMVNHTRLDCVIGVTGQMRGGLSQAVHHARNRSAFGKPLIDQPLMRNVLADLAVESEAATTLMTRLAGGYDRGEGAFTRIATAIGKYWVCKRVPSFAAEALECFGGAGYVEEAPMARLFRESPLNGIWEGSGNVICLDVLRAAAKDPESVAALLDEIALARGADARLDRAVDDLHAELADPADLELRARRIVERAALALQGSLLVRFAPEAVADAFCATRLAGDGGRAFGTLPPGTDLTAILDRAWPSA
ncbi:acyl-CoA dehydrogenase family protein [Aquihabitans sp. G128]|uniref:acyl-CoA dehydrogenase family protein n=1 Tax=Aquihabitans sp. G128 TaxID=2849779 RepID=UPI001C23CC72|nr:acyl-CoA dehydrogenase family protein [Aquihabitans sp. G128]QXC62962.1 acyl-CoA dehydrogenase family protein [Aquihabitans sp. G128]